MRLSYFENVVSAEVEQRIRECVQQGDSEQAVTLGIRTYGPEIVGFLVATERDATIGAEVFSQFCEDLWRGIGTFRGDSSFRTWAYTLARHAGHRYHRDPYRRRGVALAQHPELADLADKVRSSTLTHLKSEVRDAVSRLRDKLEPDEQALELVEPALFALFAFQLHLAQDRDLKGDLSTGFAHFAYL